MNPDKLPLFLATGAGNVYADVFDCMTLFRKSARLRELQRQAGKTRDA
jgi:hypothetical protein